MLPLEYLVLITNDPVVDSKLNIGHLISHCNTNMIGPYDNRDVPRMI